VRVGTIDLAVINDTLLGGFDVPPPEIFDLAAARTIVDLGSNIGMTVLDSARMAPEARIVAVEMEPANYAALLRHTTHLVDRLRTRHAAIWKSDGEVSIEGAHTAGFRASAAHGAAAVRDAPFHPL
jgi:hypothetical protein